MLSALLLLVLVPFVVWVRAQLRTLQETLEAQQRLIYDLERRLKEAARPPSVAAPAPRPAATPAAKPPPLTEPVQPPPVIEPPPVIAPPPLAAPPPVPTPSRPDVVPPASGVPLPVPPPPAAPPPLQPAGAAASAVPPPPLQPAGAAASAVPPPPPPLPIVPAPPSVPFDWESVVGVKLFSAIAGIALVLAAVFFLRYSIDRGWLSPAVRVVIGIIVAVALLVTCELKAARKYPATANAMDAAAIAILFATFFAAHALWQLIPSVAAFALLALVTVLAVLLSIRRDSLFIAVLGLLGGFATPALLSTGENRPIPLFAYLLLLNVGLAWVASRRKWPVLTILTLVLTAIYQWGWVINFLDASQLSLAMGIFLVFAIASFAALSLRARTGEGGPIELVLDRGGLAASAMPLVFAVYLATVPAYGARAGLLFGFLFLIDAAMLALALSRRQELVHVAGAGATLLVFAIWLTQSYLAGAWTTGTAFAALFVAFYLIAPLVADRVGRPFSDLGMRSMYAAPLLLFVFFVITGIEPAVAAPGRLFGTLFALLLLIAWRALASSRSGLYFVAAFFGVAAEGGWSASFLTAEYVGPALVLCVAFGVFYLGVPIVARRIGRQLEPVWGGGAVLLASLALLLFLSFGVQSAAALWGLALLLAILDAGLFVESASARLPALSLAGGALSWVVLAVWWVRAAAVVGLLPSLLVVAGLTLLMFGGHAWAASRAVSELADRPSPPIGFRRGMYLAFVGHFFLLFVAMNPEWSAPPWPLLGTLVVLTLAASAASLAARAPDLHAAGVIAAAVVVLGWASFSAGDDWARVALAAAEAVLAFGAAWLPIARRAHGTNAASASGLTAAAFIVQVACIRLVDESTSLSLAVMAPVYAINSALILALAWRWQWNLLAPAAIVPAFFAVAGWQLRHPEPAAWTSGLTLTIVLYATFVAYPFLLAWRARDTRAPFLTAVLASGLFFVTAHDAMVQGGKTAFVGIIPVVESAVLALLLRHLLVLQPPGERDLGRLAFVAGSALAFATVAIPLQLKNQWITIGWALEGAALAWLYRRIPHRGLLYFASALLGAVFVRLALNPGVFLYEPRGMRVFNWYLYTYLTCAIAFFAAAWWLSATDDRLGQLRLRMAKVLPACGAILLFLLLNIEIADFYATGPEIVFRFGVTLAQDLTYTLGWLVFGLGMLIAGISLHTRSARIAAVALIAVTTCKAFLYDMGSLAGLYRVGALVGLAISLSLVALALQKFVLAAPKEA